MANNLANFFRMGVLIDPPDDQFLEPRLNWSLSIIGVFFGKNPPPLSLVQYSVATQWTSRDTIIVRKQGKYYCFFCEHPRDVQALVEQHTTIIDGQIITFRKGEGHMVPSQENFDYATLWVRVCGMPFDFLHQEWAIEALRHVGYVEEIDDGEHAFHDEP
ncbi:hypothetical protein SOVF_172060 [Spinacia oleracea]|nr:hypothetical protein SOVF_172060 [Spinacia oleracea]